MWRWQLKTCWCCYCCSCWWWEMCRFGRWSLVMLGCGYEVQSWLRFWSLVWSRFLCLSFVEMLMFGWDFEVDAWSEDEIWSRCLFEFVIWTQPSGLLCLWQCFNCQEPGCLTHLQIILMSSEVQSLVLWHSWPIICSLANWAWVWWASWASDILLKFHCEEKSEP